MESTKKSAQASLFQVYLRLRPPPAGQDTPERFLAVEEAEQDAPPTHITLNPPNDNRRRAVEKFAFTEVFEEESTQLDLFRGTGVLPLVEGVLGPHGGEGRDALLATLGVTGSGKSHTILGSRTQRGLTQLALDVLFRSISQDILDPTTTNSLHATIAASDPSEAQVMSAQMFLDTMYGETSAASRASSRAPTPMVVRAPSHKYQQLPQPIPGAFPRPSLQVGDSPKSIRVVANSPQQARESSIAAEQIQAQAFGSYIPSYMLSTYAIARKYMSPKKPNSHSPTKSPIKGDYSTGAPTPRRQLLPKPSVQPQTPDISDITVNADPNAEYAILVSMYEVYNDRIFDLLTPASPNKSTKDYRRRPLLFKPTEQSPDRKVVAGLRKIICGTMKEALMVLDAGLHERRVAGTGSNSVSSRSHGFFCVEVKKRRRSRMASPWGGSALTIVDLAGSERARDAKTQGATLAEAGKINESLMYLGQCLQMQSDIGNHTKPNLVPFRQCKLTELLFSNSFPSTSNQSVPPTPSRTRDPDSHLHHRNPQKAVMIVTADPLGDFNATSQILRYSALAREITVPRIPSVTTTILAQTTQSHYFSPTRTGRLSPTDTERETMEIAALEIARMSEEIDGLRNELNAEQERRQEVEAHLESMSDRMLEFEQEVREDCYREMEGMMEQEMRRWKATWAMEADRNDEHMDRKLEIYTQSMQIPEDDKENAFAGQNIAINEDLEEENERLRREVEKLSREVNCRSPSKPMRQPLRESRVSRKESSGLAAERCSAVSDMEKELERMRISVDREDDDARDSGVSVIPEDSSQGTIKLKSGATLTGSPVKKMRKMGKKTWDVAVEEDVL